MKENGLVLLPMEAKTSPFRTVLLASSAMANAQNGSCPCSSHLTG